MFTQLVQDNSSSHLQPQFRDRSDDSRSSLSKNLALSIELKKQARALK
jgi:hypothetical protein